MQRPALFCAARWRKRAGPSRAASELFLDTLCEGAPWHSSFAPESSNPVKRRRREVLGDSDPQSPHSLQGPSGADIHDAAPAPPSSCSGGGLSLVLQAKCEPEAPGSQRAAPSARRAAPSEAKPSPSATRLLLDLLREPFARHGGSAGTGQLFWLPGLHSLGPLPQGTVARAHTLLARGADVSARDADGRDALWFAVQYEMSHELVKQILQRPGASPGQRVRPSNASLVDVALNLGHSETVRLLLRAGALPTARGAGSCLVGFAIAHGFENEARLALQRGAWRAVRQLNVQALRDCVHHGLRYQGPAPVKQGLLSAALAVHAPEELLIELLRLGADPNRERDCRGERLAVALVLSNKDWAASALATLLRHGLDPHAVVDDGEGERTLLEFARSAAVRADTVALLESAAREKTKSPPSASRPISPSTAQSGSTEGHTAPRADWWDE